MKPSPRHCWQGVLRPLAIMSAGMLSASPADAAPEIGATGPGGYCLIGQEWPGFNPDWIEPARITGGGQSFFALVEPSEGCACPEGFQLATTDFFMTIAESTPLPITISVSMGLAAAFADPGGPIAWLPGATVCASPVREFTLYIPKDVVGFGVALDCDCVTMASPYFLYFTIHSAMDPPSGLYTAGGGAPALGHFLTFADGRWVDLVDEGLLTRGDLMLSCFASCCELPIAVAPERTMRLVLTPRCMATRRNREAVES